MLRFLKAGHAGGIHMKKLSKYLRDWADKGFITAEQEEQIFAYETGKGNEQRTKWVFYGFIILGVTVIGIGIISLVAANWEKIPPSVKLANNFVMLIATAYGVLRIYDRDNEIIFDALGAFFTFLCMASIGLISQVFHTGGELFQALTFWLVIVLPITILGRRMFLPYLWAAFAVITYFLYSFSKTSYWYKIQNSYNDDVFFAIYLFLPFLLFLVGALFKKLTLFERHGQALMIGLVPAFLGAVIAMDYFLSWKRIDYLSGAALPVILTGVAALAALFFEDELRKKEKIIIGVMMGLPLVIILPQVFGEALFFGGMGKFFGAWFSLVMLFLLGLVFIIRDNKKLFHLVTLLMGIRFLVVYFQVFENLATTGFGLIISGLIIIGVALLWFKKRDNLEGWLKGVLK